MTKTKLLGSLLALSASCAFAQQMDPGEWEFTNTVTSPALPQPQTMTMKRCITGEDVKDPSRLQGKPESDCKVTPKTKTGENYSWDMACPKSGMKGSGVVRYGKGTLESETKVVMKQDGKTIEMLTKMKGRRIGACKS
jgi:hypothetical protein